ncbi:MAG: tetratricopeptide repeat protein [Patescibacteria group bacterium]|nr:tetratricopeptide repeat protein [Patescibacteria group bacterium]
MENLQELEQQAINAAINNQWDDAIKLNEKIIKKDKKNLDAYLRLGFAFMQKGNLKKAKQSYNKAKKIQPENYIIEKNLEKIKVLEAKKNKPYSTSTLSPYAFLDIPGKTKSVNLVNCGQKNVLAGLSIGQEVFLNLKKRKIEVRTKNKEYIGYLPDDISKRLTILIKAGSFFKCYIKEAELKEVVIFIKEEIRGKKVNRYAPFPINNNFTSNININDEVQESDSEEISDSDLEKLAESIINEEKEEYIDYEINEENEETED